MGSGDCQKESELDNVGETVLRAWSAGGTSGGWQFNLSRRHEGAGDEPGDLEGLPSQWSTEGPSRSHFLEGR